MIRNMEYLTDAELEILIREIEQNDLVPATSDLEEQILEALEQDTQRNRDKVIEYKRYRFRVLTTVAAAVLAVFLLPRIENLQQQKEDFVKPPVNHEFVVESRYETKEEALNDTGMMETVLGSVNIFADNSRFNLFRE